MSQKYDEAEVLRIAKKLKKKALADAGSINFFRGNGRYTDAIEKYSGAADKFRLIEEHKEAGACMLAAVDLFEKHFMNEKDVDLSIQHQYLKTLQQCADCVKEYDNNQANELYKRVALGRQERNDFATAGNIFQMLGEQEEAQENFETAIVFYSEAYDSYRTSSQPTKAGLNKLKIANIYTAQEKYKEAYEQYMELAQAAVSDKVMKHEIYTFFFKAMICAFLIGAQSDDMGYVREKNDRCRSLESTWDAEKECRTLDKLIKCYEAKDEKKFRKEYTEYKDCSNPDNFTEASLVKVLRALKGVEGGQIKGHGEQKSPFDEEPDLS